MGSLPASCLIAVWIELLMLLAPQREPEGGEEEGLKQNRAGACFVSRRSQLISSKRFVRILAGAGRLH